MKTFSKLAVLSALLATASSLALADTISLGSFATGTTAASLGFSTTQTAMNFAGYTATSSAPMSPTTPTILHGTAATYALSPNGTWLAPIGNSTWIGSSPSSAPGSATSPGYGYYQFNTLFSAVGGTYTGTLNLLGDDTLEVLLNGTVLVPFGGLGSDSHCADLGPNCSVVDSVTLNNLNLLPGLDANQLTFIVDQAGLTPNANPSGMDFSGTFASSIAPEPSSLILLGTGLLSAGTMFRRRRAL
ncbi:MAG TPA: PEP-CTERM sorting domain-containing protein [Acidobacteriaceae bacterium]|nr:PEP-CTERM sorting domain-containing protein [Acidobacteriaceae bacterium]